MNTCKTLCLVCILISASACSPASIPAPALKTSTLPPPAVTTIPNSIPAPTEFAGEYIPAIAQYGLAGRLVLVLFDESGNRLVELNLKTGEQKTLFQAPPNSWLSESVVSPDLTQILLAYAPPPPGNAPQFGYSDLYLLPYDGSSQPQPFLTRRDPQESYFFSAWAPDGQSIYFTHLHHLDPNSDVPAYQNDIEKVTLSGETETIIKEALWPAVSPDGSKIAYLRSDPVTFGNDLYLANLDGTGQTPVLQPGVNPPVDAHLFTPDGSQLIFSMVNLQLVPASTWLEKLFG